jgi:basic membrane protein A
MVRDVEPGNPVSIEPAMRAFAERNYDLVIGVGFAQGPIMQKVATDYPNIQFAIIDGVIFEAGWQNAEVECGVAGFQRA